MVPKLDVKLITTIVKKILGMKLHVFTREASKVVFVLTKQAWLTEGMP